MRNFLFFILVCLVPCLSAAHSLQYHDSGECEFNLLEHSSDDLETFFDEKDTYHFCIKVTVGSREFSSEDEKTYFFSKRRSGAVECLDKPFRSRLWGQRLPKWIDGTVAPMQVNGLADVRDDQINGKILTFRSCELSTD